MSKAGRDKGKLGEQQVASLLLPLYPEVRTKRAGGESASVDRGRDLLGTPGLCVQVKNMMRPDGLRALAEAVSVMGSDEIPVAFIKRSVKGVNQYSIDVSGKWCVVMLADDFIGLLRTSRVSVERLEKYVRSGVQVGE